MSISDDLRHILAGIQALPAEAAGELRAVAEAVRFHVEHLVDLPREALEKLHEFGAAYAATAEIDVPMPLSHAALNAVHDHVFTDVEQELYDAVSALEGRK